MGKKKVVLPRDITQEDVQDLKGTLFSSEFDVLEEISRRARKLYEEEAQKLKISRIEVFDPSSLETHNAQKSWIKKSDLTVDDSKGLESGPHIPPIHALFQVSSRGKELLIDEEALMKKASLKEGKGKLILSSRREEDFHCPMPEAAAKRQRMLMREKNLKKPFVTENPEWGYVNKRKWYKRVDNEVEEEEEEEDKEWASMVTDFLTENEQQQLLERTSGGRYLKGIGVLFIEPNGDQNLGGLVFKRWVMPKDIGRNSSTVYLFNGKWHDLCKKHN